MRATARFLSADNQRGGWDISCFVEARLDTSNVGPSKNDIFVSTNRDHLFTGRKESQKALPLEFCF